MRWFLLPSFIHCFFHLLLLHFPLHTSLEMPFCESGDSSALLQLKNSFVVNTLASYNYCSSSSNKTASWENGTNCCQWDGVTCDAMSGHVIGLDLSCSNLQGKLHPNSTLFRLTHLQKLNLAFNDFSGSLLYSGIGDLVSLTHLNISESSFNGDIPSTISHLSKLSSLDLAQYDYGTGDSRLRLDPYTWDKLILNASDLEELVLDGANLSLIREGSLTLLMNLSSTLVSLYMRETELQGNLSCDILSLPNLQELSLPDNGNLRGELPNSNWSTPLRHLDLSWTAFSGKIPSSIGHLKHLNQLFFTSCRFDGLVPLSLWNLTQLAVLDVSGNTLNGEIPSLLSNLMHLTTLTLAKNDFNGQIPDVFGRFTKLDSLALSFNNLGGQLPSSLFDLTQLSYLDLSNNKLVGPIPNEINKLSKLKSLDLSNNFLNGTIPHWCFSLSPLIALKLDGNQLSGSISEFSTYSLRSLLLSNNKIEGNFPNSIFEMKNLTHLSFSSNNLSGPVDFQKFSKLKNLQGLYLSQNNFLFIDSSAYYILPNLYTLSLSSCNITNFPEFLTRLQNLVQLDLSNNKIHGKVPIWFNNLLLSWKSIQFVDLSFNKLEGDVPIPPQNTEFFSVSNNNLTGDISSGICNASSLKILILSHNNLAGMIPQCLGTFPYLTVLNLQMNNLHGSIPGNFSESNSFKTIQLNGNRLEGPLPESLANCTMLQVLDLGDNNMEDVFPSWLETLQELQVLVLRANKFYGTITSFSAKNEFPELSIFDVSNNNFSGPLPTSYFKKFQGMMNGNQGAGFGYVGSNSTVGSYHDSVTVIMKGESIELRRILTILTTIDLSNNMFEGEIPQVIGELNSLIGLNLSGNAITGVIPISLGNLRSLEWLDLSWNQLRGEIPMTLTNLNFLSFLNLSQNQLEGIIPIGRQFNTFLNDSYGGNPMLCGFPLSKSCSDDEEPPPVTFHQEEELGFGWRSVAVGYACGMVFGMLLGYGFFLSGKPLWLVRLVGMPDRKVKE